MDFEIDQRCDDERNERTDDPINSRNGYRERLSEPRAGPRRPVVGRRPTVQATALPLV